MYLRFEPGDPISRFPTNRWPALIHGSDSSPVHPGNWYRNPCPGQLRLFWPGANSRPDVGNAWPQTIPRYQALPSLPNRTQSFTLGLSSRQTHGHMDTQTQAAKRVNNKQTRLRLLMHRLSNPALPLKVDGEGLAAINDQTDGFRVLHSIEESRASFCRPIIC